MSEWWWIVLTAMAAIVAMEFMIMRRRDTASGDGSVIDVAGDAPGDWEIGLLADMKDVGRARQKASLARQRERQQPNQSP